MTGKEVIRMSDLLLLLLSIIVDQNSGV